MSGIASLFVEIGAKTEGLTSGLKTAESGLSGLAGKAGGLISAAATGFGFAIAGPIIGSVGGLFQQVTQGVMGTNSALEQSGTAWGVLLGGADQAQAKIAELFAFGASTPFEFGEVDKASRVLQTFGGNALNTKDNLTMIGDVASGVGQPFGDVAMWTARMYDSFKNGTPFGEAAARLQEMGAMSGETRLKLEQMQAAGASQEELWATLSGSFGKFGGMMQQQSGTFSGMLSTMQDSLNMLFATAGKPIFDAVTAGLGKFNQLLSSPAVQEGATRLAQNIANGLKSAASAIGAFVGKVAAIVPSLGAAFSAIASGNFQGAFLAIMDVIGKVFGQDSMAVVSGFVGQAMGFLWNLATGAVSVFQTIAGFVTGTLIPAIVAFVPVAVAAFQSVAAWVTGTLVPAMTQFGTILIGAFNTAMPVIQSFVSTVLPQIVTGFQSLVPHLQAIGTFLVTGFQTAVPIIQAFAAGVLPALTAGFAQVSAAVQTIAPYVTSFVATLQAGLAVIVPALQAFGSLLMTAIGGALQQIVPLVQQFIGVFQAQLPAIIGLGGQLSGVWEQVKAAMSALAPVGIALAAVLGGLIAAAVGITMGAIGGFVGMLSGVLPGAIQIVSGAITVMGGVFQTLAAVIGGVVSIVTNLIHGDWSGAWEAAKTMVSQASEGIKTIVSGLWQMLQGLFQAAIGAITGYVTGFVTTIGGFFQALYTKLTGDTTSFGTMISTAWTTLTTNVSTGVSTFVTSIGTFFSNMGTAVSTTVTTLVTNVITFFTNLATQARAKVVELVTGVLSEFDNMVSQIRAAMNNFVTAVLNGITGLIGSAASAAAQVGSAIVNGIAGAISSGAGAIADAARNAAQSALDAAKGLLGINSPSKAFHAVGMGVIEGFANGITASSYLGVAAVQEAMQRALDVGDSMASKVALSGLDVSAGNGEAVANGGNSRGAVIVNVTNHIAGSVMADRDLTETIADRINQLSYVRRI